MFLGNNYVPNPTPALTGHESSIDKWILHCLNSTVVTVNKCFENYELGTAADAVHSFIYDSVCDVYLEAIKPVMNSKDGSKQVLASQAAVRATLYTVFDEGFKLIHPFMPYISEELWQRFPRRPDDLTESICVSVYPRADPAREAPEVHAQVTQVNKLINSCRSVQALYNITRKHKPLITINAHSTQLKDLLVKYTEMIVTLAYLGNLEVTHDTAHPPKGCAAEIPDSTCEIYLHIKGLVDFNQEKTRLVTKLKQTQDNKDQLIARQGQADYAYVPDFIKEQNQAKLASLDQELTNVNNAVRTIQNLLDEQ